MIRNDNLGLRVAREVKEALRQAAAAEDRSISWLVEHIIQQWLATTGRSNSGQKDKKKPKPKPRARRRSRR